MAGGRETFDKAVPMNSIGFFGLHAMTAGSYDGEADGGSCYEEQDEHRMKRFFIRDGRLTGFILIGETAAGRHLHLAYSGENAAEQHSILIFLKKTADFRRFFTGKP